MHRKIEIMFVLSYIRTVRILQVTGEKYYQKYFIFSHDPTGDQPNPEYQYRSFYIRPVFVFDFLEIFIFRFGFNWMHTKKKNINIVHLIYSIMLKNLVYIVC